MKLKSLIARWESLLGVAIVAIVISGVGTRGFLTAPNLTSALTAVTPVAIMALGMTLVIISGEIDLSIASTLALSSSIFGLLVLGEWPFWIAILGSLIVGILAGAFNGFLVVTLGLPSLVVTLGTMTLYRGLSFVALGETPVSTLPEELIAFANGRVSGTLITWPVLLFLILFVPFALYLQKGYLGRRLYAIGSSAETARFSGAEVNRTKFGVFVIAGLSASIGGIILTGYLSSARAEIGAGLELDVIAIVLLGGVSIFGGVGRVTGVALALLLYVLLTNLLSLQNVSADDQQIIVGALLIGAVIASNVMARVTQRGRAKRPITKIDPTVSASS